MGFSARAKSPGIPRAGPRLLAGITALRGLLALAAFACLVLLAVVLPAPAEVKELLVLYGCSLLGIPLLLQWFFQGHDEMHWVALASLVRYGVFAGLVLATLAPEMSLRQVGLIECAAVAAAGLLCLAVAAWRFRVRPLGGAISWRGATAYLREAVPIGLTELVWALLWYIATVLAGLMVRDHSLGWFGASHRILMALHTFVWLYFFNLLQSIARTSHGRQAELERLLGTSLRLTAWPGMLVALVGTLASGEMLRLAYGAAFGGGGRMLATLLWVIPVALASGHYRYALIACGRQSLLMRATGCAALVVAAGCLLLVPHIGTLGAAWSLLAGCLVELGLTKAYLERYVVRVPLLASVGRPTAAACGLALLHGLSPADPLSGAVTMGLVFLGVMALSERGELRRWVRALRPIREVPAPGRRFQRPAALSFGAVDALLLLTMSAAVLRFERLDSQLWLDEVLTLVDIVRLPLGEIVSSFPSQNQHMLYSILAWLAVEIFGESAWALRLPAVVFGVLSLWPLYALGLRLVGHGKALVAGLLMTFSYHHIWFSQNARGYTGLLVFATLATWLWIEATERRRWAWWLSYSGAVFLGVWIQMTMLFVVAAHGLLYLVSLARRRSAFSEADRLRPLVAWLLAGSLSLQVYAFSLPEFLRSAAGEVSMPSAWTDPLWLAGELVRNLAVVPGGVVAVVAGGAVLALGWWTVFRQHAEAALAMALPVVLCGVTMLALGHNLWPRFFFFAMGFALLLVVEGAVRLGDLVGALLERRWAPAQYAGPALAVLLVVAFIATSGKAWALPKQDYLGAKAYVEAQRQPGDAVVTVGLAAKVYRDYYASDWTICSTPEELDRLRRSHERVWLVYTLPVQLQGFLPDLWAAIQHDFSVVKTFPGTLGGGEVYVCRERTATVE